MAAVWIVHLYTHFIIKIIKIVFKKLGLLIELVVIRKKVGMYISGSCIGRYDPSLSHVLCELLWDLGQDSCCQRSGTLLL